MKNNPSSIVSFWNLSILKLYLLWQSNPIGYQKISISWIPISQEDKVQLLHFDKTTFMKQGRYLLQIKMKSTYAISIEIKGVNWVYIDILWLRSERPGVSKVLKYEFYFKYMMKYLHELKQTKNMLEGLLP